MFPNIARIELTIMHDGMVTLHTCPSCTGTIEDVIEALDQVISTFRKGVDDDGRSIGGTIPGLN